ncbi:hypothetical protein [Krasilnikovia sp. M28-CT-15]|uniref:hypothetical protein n=1 Tax=Krasilnikovia sp. M28-CT-15 TaxID=3373540 RepID=UPI00399D12B0
MDLPALPFGFWLDDGVRDHIIYRSGVAGFHRDHIILHELCHMLAGHNATGEDGQSHAGVDIDRLIERAMTNRFNDRQEDVAEMFASRVLKVVHDGFPGSLSDFEQHAAAMFGAA